MEYIQDIIFDLNLNTAPPIINAKQNDVNSRFLRVHYVRDGVPYDVDINNSVALRILKPDGKKIMDDALVQPDGSVLVTLTQQCLAAAGRAFADLVEINSLGQMLSTMSFIINIQPMPDVMDDTMISSDEFLYLKTFIDRGNSIIGEAQEWANGYNGDIPVSPDNPAYENNAKYWSEQAEEQVELAALNGEAWAEGTRNGAAVPSSDPAYHHNAKYWSEQADLNGEARAEGTRNGIAVPSSDPAYHHNAKYWSEQAQLNGETQATIASQNGEAWSVGTRGGAAVPSSDPAYNNYSKYWALRTKACIDTIQMSYNVSTGVLSMTIDDL